MRTAGIILLILGLVFAVSAYSFHGLLWYDSYHHLLSIAFPCYMGAHILSSIRLKDSKAVCLSFFILACMLNAVFDELTNNFDTHHVSEYITIFIVGIIIFLVWRNGRSK